MSRKDPLDARKSPSDLSKRAEFPLGELIPEEERKKLQPEKPAQKELPGEAPMPTPEEAEELPEVRKTPGGPQHTVRPRIPGQSAESPDVPGYTSHEPMEHTGLSPEELRQKREELGVSEEPVTEKPSWRDVAKEKLKSLDPKQRAKEKMEERYGPSEKLQEASNGLNEFAENLANVDLAGAKQYINSLDLPELIKERADRLFRGMRYDPGSPRADEHGEIPIGEVRVFQHALNQLKATTTKEIEKATNWLQETPEGQSFLEHARDQYLIRNVMNMLNNTVLRQEGEGVIRTEPRPERKSPQQKREEKRIKSLEKQLEEEKITQEEFERKLKEEPFKEPTKEKSKEVSKETANLNALNDLQRRFNAKEISEEEYRRERARLLKAKRLNLRKQADITGPGGEDWFPGYESGPQVNRDKYKKRKRFPFDNEPSADVRVDKGPAKHDLPVPDGSGTAGDDSWGLLAAIDDTIRKTADNDLFECYSYGEITHGPWFGYTLFKRAYQTFKSGDIVVQFGKTPKDLFTYRRRFGNVSNAKRNINAALLPAISTVITVKEADKAVLPKSVRLPGKATPSESLHDVPDSKDNPAGGVYGPYTGEYDKQPWQGNRDGFDRPKPRREQDLKRNVFPYEDQEVSNQTKIFGKLNLHKQSEVNGYAVPVVETPEERASTIEQDIPKPINWDPARPFPPKRKRHDLNESQLFNENEYTSTPKTLYTSKLNLKKQAFDFNVSIFDPQTGEFKEDTILSAPSIEQAQVQAQEFVNKSYPGYSFQVTDPMNQTPKTLGINYVKDTNLAFQRGNKLKYAQIDPSKVNALINLYMDLLGTTEATPETINTTTKNALLSFVESNPGLNEKELLSIAIAADSLMLKNNQPSNFANTVQGNPLF